MGKTVSWRTSRCIGQSLSQKMTNFFRDLYVKFLASFSSESSCQVFTRINTTLNKKPAFRVFDCLCHDKSLLIVMKHRYDGRSIFFFLVETTDYTFHSPIKNHF